MTGGPRHRIGQEIFNRGAVLRRQLHALATWADVLRGVAGEQLAAQDRSAIENFLADPVAWSTRHGGRAARSANG